jgi:hypothetical protein
MRIDSAVEAAGTPVKVSGGVGWAAGSGRWRCPLGLRDRGLLQAGMFADAVVFDPDTVTDQAAYDDLHRLSTGVVLSCTSGSTGYRYCGTGNTRARCPEGG